MRLTDFVTITFDGLGKQPKTFIMPSATGRRIKNLIASMEQPGGDESIPARKVLPELADDRLRPATLLRGARHKAGLTQKNLAGRLGVHQHHLSEMENGKRSIGRQMARRLAKALRCDYRLFV
jgi:DNA-binding XRE family transcriptional regulator